MESVERRRHDTDNSSGPQSGVAPLPAGQSASREDSPGALSDLRPGYGPQPNGARDGEDSLTSPQGPPRDRSVFPFGNSLPVCV